MAITLFVHVFHRRVNAVNAELAGVIMSFCLSIGLGCGAVMSFLLIRIV